MSRKRKHKTRIPSMSRRCQPQEVARIMAALQRAVGAGLVERWDEGSMYLFAAFRGAGTYISPKWNVKIYTLSEDPHKRRLGQSLVCVDFDILDAIVSGQTDTLTPSDKPVIVLDDSGWGFPLCGVMVGASDGKTVMTDVVPVEYFRDNGCNSFDSGEYLHEYARRGRILVEGFGGTPKTHRIEICTGYVNSVLRQRLRDEGFEVRVVEVRGLLQDSLESLFRKYVEGEIGRDIYYDPKEVEKKKVPKLYGDAVRFGKEHCPHLLKNGWKALKGE